MCVVNVVLHLPDLTISHSTLKHTGGILRLHYKRIRRRVGLQRTNNDTKYYLRNYFISAQFEIATSFCVLLYH